MILKFTFFNREYLFSCFFLLLVLVFTSCEKHPDFHQDPGAPSFPWEGNGDTLNPEIFSDTFNIIDFGAVGDGSTFNTSAIQRALNAVEKRGGGTILIPEGTFLTAPITLSGNINLHLAKDAILQFTDNYDSIPVKNGEYVNFLEVAESSSNIKITGKGTIDGQGQRWWNDFESNNLTNARPQMIYMRYCSNIEITGITTLNPPNTHISFNQCRDVDVHDVHIKAPETSPNTDGINLSGSDITIKNCIIETGDDNVALNVGHLPVSKNIHIEGCTFGTGHGVSVGSFTNGGLEGLTVRNCTFDGGVWGLRLKSSRDRGGVIRDLSYSNIQIKNVRYPIYVNSYYPKAPEHPESVNEQSVTETTPIWRQVKMDSITITNCPNSINIWALPESPIDSVEFNHMEINTEHGININYAENIVFKNTNITVAEGDKIVSYKADIKGL